MEYKDSLNLPKTDFKMKANLPNNEPKKLQFWNENNIYQKLTDKNKDGEKFIFHDGPPYANGDIHYGHILNKILKDFVIKYKNMSGKQTKVINGWDCHGLPIELQVDKKIKKKKREMTKQQLIEKYREYAITQVNNQKEQFKRLGVFSDWNITYKTMDFQYEAQIVREFGKIAEKGALYKGKKPVHWCSSCVTALAEAEIEYDDHTSFSVYVKFKLNYEFEGVEELKGKDLYVVIWTTTPWTLPANMGISLNPKFEYSVIELDGEYLIMATDLIEAVKADAELEGEYRTVHKFKGNLLDNETCDHPFINRKSLIMNGDHVTLEAGTGCVHTAPGHGMDDYIIGLKYGLDVFNPVDNYGKYTDDYPEMKGVKISEANKTIETMMHEKGILLNKPGKRIRHSYPHCWRCGNPVIFRATKQWFIPMDGEFKLREKTLKEIKNVEWIPKWGEDRINGMISNRPDWCISRQRTWGIPIPVFYCENEECDTEVLDVNIINKVADAFEKEGIAAWYNHDTEYFLGEGYKCKKCGGTHFRKEKDILDVWFDSGVSYAAVMENMQHETEKIDLYLEGSDQHRGWFHSSLLTSMITRNHAPYKKVLTHGFVMAADGKKLSKKLKNYEPPQRFINTQGVEILRLWVAAEDYRNDTRFGQEIIKRIKEAYRKFRNTMRYALSNLYDFNIAENEVKYGDMHPLDKWAMNKINGFVKKVIDAYENYEFHLIYYYMNELCAADLSSFYFSIIKDTLYVEAPDSPRRRGIQTVLFHIADKMAKLLAPVMSFTAEEIYQSIPNVADKKESVFLEDLPVFDTNIHDDELLSTMTELRKVKDEVQKELEKMRKDKIIGQNLDARVEILLPENVNFDILLQKGAQFNEFLSEIALFLIVSDVKIVTEADSSFVDTEMEGLKIKVAKAEGEKCERCWTWHVDTNKNKDFENTCPRCAAVMKEIS